ncbi:MAG: hypothetical protein AB1331_02940 [Bacillota bacterium]
MEMTEQRRDEVINWITDQIAKRGMVTPAILFLEMSKPVSLLASSAMTFLDPIIGTATNSQLNAEIAEVLRDRRNVERLLDCLEERGKQQEKEEREAKQRAREERARRREEARRLREARRKQ